MIADQVLADARPKKPQALLYDLVEQAKGQATVPDAVNAKALTCLEDFLSCSLEAATLPWSQQALAVAAASGGGCAIIGDAVTTSAEGAAFANAVRGHGLVREDMHAGSISHMGVVVWPVVLALAAEHPQLSGDPMMAAIAGYEIGGRIGRMLITPQMARHFRPTGLIGPVAGAMAGAMLLGLDREQAVSALALAANAFGGLNEWPHSGADDMYFHPGFAARSAVTALRLAASGARGSATALDGVAGLFAGFNIPLLPSAVSLYPGGAYEVSAVFNKEVPACNFAQSPCQVALAAARRIKPGDSIARLHLSTYEAALNYPGCNHRGAFETPLQAKMSIFFGMAATLVHGEIAESNYARLNDPQIAELIAKTTITVSDELDRAFPVRQGAVLRVETVKGDVIVEAQQDVKPATPALVRARLQMAAQERLGAARAAQLNTAVEAMRHGSVTAQDLAEIARLCRTAEGEGKG